MRIEALHVGRYSHHPTIEPWEVLGDYGKERNARHPELADLLVAKEANALVNSDLLSRDELEFANFIINKLDSSPDYVPSITLLIAIRSINAKLALGHHMVSR